MKYGIEVKTLLMPILKLLFGKCVLSVGICNQRNERTSLSRLLVCCQCVVFCYISFYTFYKYWTLLVKLVQFHLQVYMYIHVYTYTFYTLYGFFNTVKWRECLILWKRVVISPFHSS